MAENTQELELIRMLIVQNGEAIQLLRATLEAAKEKDKHSNELYKELLLVVQNTGAIDFLAKQFRKPHIVPPAEPEEKTG